MKEEMNKLVIRIARNSRDQKLSLKTDNPLFFSAHNYSYLEDIKISFEDVDFYAQMLLIMDTLVRNSTTQGTLLHIVNHVVTEKNIKTFKSNSKICKRQG